MAHDVFISYSSKDKPIADEVCAALEADGIPCWIAPRDIGAGTDWNNAILDAISASRTIVLIWSSHSNQSPDVILEIKHAFRQNIPVIPFRVEDVTPSKSLEYYLAFVQSLDALTAPLETHVDRLKDHIRKVLQQSPEYVADPPAPGKGSKAKPRWTRPLIIAVGLLVVVTLTATWWRYYERAKTTQDASASATAADKLRFKVDYPVSNGKWVYAGWDQKRLFEKPVVQRLELEDELRTVVKSSGKNDQIEGELSGQWHAIHLSKYAIIPPEIRFDGLIDNRLTCSNCHAGYMGANIDRTTPRTTCAKCHTVN